MWNISIQLIVRGSLKAEKLLGVLKTPSSGVLGLKIFKGSYNAATKANPWVLSPNLVHLGMKILIILCIKAREHHICDDNMLNGDKWDIFLKLPFKHALKDSEDILPIKNPSTKT